jgi:hypothetical protein
MELTIESWTFFLYINSVIEMYLPVWVPIAVATLLLARKIYKYRRNIVKIQPLLGVVGPKSKFGPVQSGVVKTKKK